jgi:hypothetical protein
MKDVIVSYSSVGREDYFSGQMKLIRSIKESNWCGDVLMWADGGYCDNYLGYDIQLCFPKQQKFVGHRQSEIPYQFKYVAVQAAREMGYERIFWLDASMRVAGDLSELFDLSESGIVSFHNLGHDLYNFISDSAVKNLGVTEEELHNIPQIWGGAIGFDFTKGNVSEIFDEIIHQSMIGSFANGGSNRNGFIAHRHDQATLSVIFYKNNVKLLPYGNIVLANHAKEPYEWGIDYYLICGDV